MLYCPWCLIIVRVRGVKFYPTHIRQASKKRFNSARFYPTNPTNFWKQKCDIETWFVFSVEYQLSKSGARALNALFLSNYLISKLFTIRNDEDNNAKTVVTTPANKQTTGV